jgi:FG-GAP-like repeat
LTDAAFKYPRPRSRASQSPTNNAATDTDVFGEPPASDFNGDFISDVLWRQDGIGQVYIWEMNGLQTKGEGRVENVTNDWHIQGVGDFNGDFNSDILWRQDTGQVYIWEMSSRQINEEGSPPHAPVPNDWHIEGTGDFDGDFKSDILWRHDSGQTYIWEMNGLQVQAEGAVAHAAVTNDWHVQGVGDFNGDGNSDVLWRQDGSGQTYIWEMNGQQVQAEGAVVLPPARATVPPWLPAKSARVSNLPACCAPGPPASAAQYSCRREPCTGRSAWLPLGRACPSV